MKKYNQSIFGKRYVEEALKISLWERFLLLFVPTKRIKTDEAIVRCKYLFDKFYLLSFQLKDEK